MIERLGICLDEYVLVFEGWPTSVVSEVQAHLQALNQGGASLSSNYEETISQAVYGYLLARKQTEQSRQVSVLELQAKTQASSQSRLQCLEPYHANLMAYDYGDIPAGLLNIISSPFPQLQNVLSAIDSAELQDLQATRAGQYDIVIASENALVDYFKLRQRIRYLKSLLMGNGILIWVLPASTASNVSFWQLAQQEGLQVVFPFSNDEEHNDSSRRLWILESDGIVRLPEKHRLQGVVAKPLNGGVDTDTGRTPAEISTAYRESSPQQPPEQTSATTQAQLMDKSILYFQHFLAKILKTSAKKISAVEDLSEYGIDSILVLQLTSRLREVFDEVSSTVFFECKTVTDLANYFIARQTEKMQALTGLSADLTKPQLDINKEQIKPDSVTPKAFDIVNTAPGPISVKSEQPQAPHASSVGQNIAIIGLAGRYPQANSLDEYWQNLKEGKNCVTDIPSDRWDWRQYFDQHKGQQGCAYTKSGGFIADVDKFDPLFFQISPAEAELIDPQERLFLEHAYAAIEDAGYVPENLCNEKRVGVFVGVMNGTYPGESNYWSIANRVSYQLDFYGPSMAVDSACSASATAIHLALESLYTGTSKCAIAGGVNVVVDPEHYLRLSSMTVLSAGDKCRSYGEGADGFIDAEGVGVVVLKPQEQAEADGDHIYGIIKGSAINAGGKTNGYTVPNPIAQARVISDALARAGVDARTIGYVEGHGTGTALGDPIEIAGLTRAYQQYTQDRQYCALGSVKSNIGHCESAAAMAGLSKILLQFRAGQLAPTLHAESINPEIQMTDSPFVLQRGLTKWPRMEVESDGVVRTLPRRAALSSFGAGGANSHLIIEEYCAAPESPALSPAQVVMIVLSARNSERLQAKIEQLSVALANNQLADARLEDIAYTLQVGRRQMDTRLAMTVSSVSELKQTLHTLIAQGENATECQNVYFGHITEAGDSLSILAGDDDLTFIVDQWISKQKYHKLLALWVKGLDIDWQQLSHQRLYHQQKVKRISLPTYPFERRRCWISPTPSPRLNKEHGQTVFHPLLHENVSDIFAQRYASRFSTEEFFLTDHKVQKRAILPGACYLEMAYAAVRQSLAVKHHFITLHNVVWLKPFYAQEVLLTEITLQKPSAHAHQSVKFSLYCLAADGADTERHILCQGEAHLVEKSIQNNRPDSEHNRKITMRDMRESCASSTFDIAKYYQHFENMGIEYGESHRTITQMFVGQGEVVAEIRLPAALTEGHTDYCLHPSLLDAALQTTLVLTGEQNSSQPYLPFSLQTLEVYGSCEPTVWVSARIRAMKNLAPQAEQSKPTARPMVDIDIFNVNGKLLASLKDFVSLQSSDSTVKVQEKGSLKHATPAIEAQANLVELVCSWKPLALPTSSQDTLPQLVGANDGDPQRENSWLPGTPMLALCLGQDDYIALQQTFVQADIMDMGTRSVDRLCAAIEAQPSALNILLMFSADTSNAQPSEQASILLYCWQLTKELISRGLDKHPLKIDVVTRQGTSILSDDSVNPRLVGVQNYFSVLAKAYPDWQVRQLDLCEQSHLNPRILACLPSFNYPRIHGVRRGQWYAQQLLPIQLPKPSNSLYRQGGVYVVVGGVGGMGEAWSEYMVTHYQAHIVLLDSQPINQQIEHQCTRIAAYGPKPHYIQTATSDKSSIQQALRQILARHSRIHGLVHSAQDSDFNQTDVACILESNTTKGAHNQHLSAVFATQIMDFVLFFSSLTVFSRFTHQTNLCADYAFFDSYAYQLNQFWSCPVKTVNLGHCNHLKEVTTEHQHDKQEGVAAPSTDQVFALLERFLASPLLEVGLAKLTTSAVLPLLDKKYVMDWMKPKGPQLPMRQVKAGIDQQMLDYHQQHMQLNALQLELMGAQLHDLGFSGSSLSDLPSKMEAVAIVPFFKRWLEESLLMLEESGYFNVAKVDTKTVWQRWSDFKNSYRHSKNVGAKVRLLDKMIGKMPDILRGKTSAVDILFHNGSLERVEGIYKDNPIADYFNHIVADVVIDHIKARRRSGPDYRANPLRILEIGAGTGGTSSVLFQRLKNYQADVEEYRYTDLSQVFLLHAKETYLPNTPYLTTSILNVEEPIDLQGIEAGSFDLVIATNVLHATKNIGVTLRHAKQCLARDGLIVINELTQSSLFAHVTFGLLDGWWRYEDAEVRLRGCPGLSTQSWRYVLAREGYLDSYFPGASADPLGQQVIVARSDGFILQASDELPVHRELDTTEMALTPKSPMQAPARALETVREIAQCQTVKHSQKQLIEALSGSTSSLGTQEQLTTFVQQQISQSIEKVLKLSSADYNNDQAFSDYGVDSIVAVKLVNHINQNLDILLQTVDLFDYSSVLSLADYIVTEHGGGVNSSATFTRKTAALTTAVEQQFVSPKFTTPLNNSLDTGLNDAIEHPVQADPSDVEKNRYHKVMIAGPGEIDDLQLVQVPAPALNKDLVRISVRAYSLNFADLLCVRGLYPTMPLYPFTPGFELSGVVVAVGDEVSQFSLGDKVVAMTGPLLGGQASMIDCPVQHIFHQPSLLNFAQACAFPAVTMTAWNAFSKANPRAGERILIQTATGGVGLVAVQLAKHYGLEIYATAGSEAKLDYLRKLGVRHCINYVNEDFAETLMNLTDGKGVDIILNTLSGDALQKGLQCLSPRGRYIEIAMTALKSAKAIDLSVLKNNQSFFSIDLRRLSIDDIDSFNGLRDESVRLIEQGIVRPVIHCVFQYPEVKSAHACLSERCNIGKVIVEIPAHLQFQQAPPLMPALATEVMAKPVTDNTVPERVAIIGMSGRFGSAQNVDELWQHLKNGDSLIENVSRWDLTDDAKKADALGQGYCKQGSFLKYFDCFDPLFFSISGLEALYMDPQQRLFLENCWHTLEDAGYADESIKGSRCGVYVGCAEGDYQRLVEKADTPPPQSYWGNTNSITPARIAYHLNLQGPAMVVDTACSSSLSAIHLACQALGSGDIDSALAGGVFVQSTAQFYVRSNRASMLSPTGRCFTFDSRADGFVPGEGVGVVMLKLLSRAQADGDHIHAVICASGSNQDGATNGITAPSAKSQERLIRSVYDKAQINAGQIQMVEAHGTGTPLGDPIEFNALTRAYRHDTEAQHYCALGSIKTNVGHTVTAAGVAGLIKVLLALKHKQIPPSLNFVKCNPKNQLVDSPFYINTQLHDWHVTAGEKRRAAISSFGFSGTNVHIVVEEAPVAAIAIPDEVDQAPQIFVLSARNESQLRQQVVQFCTYLYQNPKGTARDIAFTLFSGRKHFNHRLACIATSLTSLKMSLQNWLIKGEEKGEGDAPSNNAALICYGILEDDRASPSAQTMAEIQGRLATFGQSATDQSTLQQAAQWFCEGLGMQNALLFNGANLGQPNRVPLPLYPFARKRHWLTNTDVDSGSRPAKGGKANETPERGVLLRPHWQYFRPSFNALTVSKGTCLIIGAADATQKHLLEQQGLNCHLLDPLMLASPEAIEHRLLQLADISTIVWLSPSTSGVESLNDLLTAAELIVMQCFTLIKALLAQGYGQQSLSWSVITHNTYDVLGGEPIDPTQAGLHGLLGSMAKEYENWSVTVVDIDRKESMGHESTTSLVLKLSGANLGVRSAYRQGRWYQQTLQSVPSFDPLSDPLSDKQNLHYRRGGVYIVIGGAGGVGQVWSQHLIQHYQAQIIWLGRRPLNRDIESQLSALAALGSTPVYYSVDAESLAALQAVYAQIKQRFGQVHGVVHSGLNLQDQSLATMSEARFLAGMSAKLKLSVRLAQVFADESLDFVLFFSSLMSMTTSAGQSNYAAGCTFADAFALRLAQTWPCLVKVMNWGYWGSVGRVASAQYRQRMRHGGIASIEAQDGLGALDQLFGDDGQQLGYIKVIGALSQSGLFITDTEDGTVQPAAQPAVPATVTPPIKLSLQDRLKTRMHINAQKQKKSAQNTAHINNKGTV
jgi:acyl transferase domain-containing protein/NADPH:quinone reductase-like Zn-dependent oxidoreductase/acyl carrier protein